MSHQTRSISLFGWASKKPSDEIAASNPNPPVEGSGQVFNTSPNNVESIRTVKASHATSEGPDPSLNPHSINSLQPDAIRDLENSIINPHDAATLTGDGAESPELASIPEGLGYLKDVCGLDFGWGPTSLMQFCLEHIHITAGLSWSASIIALAFLIRGSIFPFALVASDQTAKFQEMSPTIKQLSEKSKAAMAENKRQAAVEAQMQVRELKRESGLSFFKMFRPLLIQMPLGYGAWHLLRSASIVPVPGFESETWMWVSNLAVADPTYMLPLATAAITFWNLSTAQKTQQSAVAAAAVARYIIPLITGAFLSFQPAAAQIYFFFNGIFTQIQFTAFQNGAFRRTFKMTPLPSPSASKPGANAPPTRFAQMNMARKPTAAPVASESDPASAAERSIFDKGVDQFKEMKQQVWNKTYTAASEGMKKHQKERTEKYERERLQTAAAKYEAQRRQDLEMQRMYRNAANSEKSGSSRSR